LLRGRTAFERRKPSSRRSIPPPPFSTRRRHRAESPRSRASAPAGSRKCPSKPDEPDELGFEVASDRHDQSIEHSQVLGVDPNSAGIGKFTVYPIPAPYPVSWSEPGRIIAGKLDERVET